MHQALRQSKRQSVATRPNPLVSLVRTLVVLSVIGSIGTAGLVALAASPAQALPTDWAIVTTPSQSYSLNGVSCVSKSFCFAAGGVEVLNGIGIQMQTLTEEWNGSTWSIVTSPDPAGTEPAELSSVSCYDATHCVAVGNVGTGTTASFSEIWNGSAWSLMSTKNPGREGGDLEGVSCPSPTLCMAVGYKSAAADEAAGPALIEKWDGSTWSVSAKPDLSRYGNNLEGISCVKPTACTATGTDDGNGTSSTNSLVERWNGSDWARQTSANVANSWNDLSAVSCPPTGECVAVGTSFASASATWSPLAEVSAHGSWSISVTPTVAGDDTYLKGVSCTSSSNCVAVGYYQNTSDVHQTLIEQWNGVSWQIVSSPNVASQDSYLWGVRCFKASECFAAGLAGNAGLVEEGT